MNRLYPLTPEEQSFAEKNFHLIPDFLSYHRLLEIDWYDVVVFGYLEAVQIEFRKSCPSENKNFPALARLCMKGAVCRELRDTHKEKRLSNINAVSMDCPLSEDDDSFTLHSLIPDNTWNPENLLESGDLIEQIFSVATEREQDIVRLYAAGFEAFEIADVRSFNLKSVYKVKRNLRAKVLAKLEGRDIKSTDAEYSRRYREKNHDAVLERERKRWAANKEILNAKRRARAAMKRAAKKAALDGANTESGSTPHPR